MSRDFLNEFRNKIKDIDKPLSVELNKENSLDLNEISTSKRYNLRQITLPGCIAKTIGWNLSEEEIERLLRLYYLVKSPLDNELEQIMVLKKGVQQDNSLIFYEKIATDASIEEQDVFYNPPKIIKDR